MEPPIFLADDLKAIWDEVIDRLPPAQAAKVNPVRLEAYASQIKAMRDAYNDVALAGVTHEDARGRTVANPALAVIRDLHTSLSKWGNEFMPVTPPKRRRGPMFDATTQAIANAEHLSDKAQYAGAIAAVKTLAWLIDEAQREGLPALHAATVRLMHRYLEGCAALQITPASAPGVAAPAEGRPTGGKLGSLTALVGGAA